MHGMHDWKVILFLEIIADIVIFHKSEKEKVGCNFRNETSQKIPDFHHDLIRVSGD